MAGTTYGYNQKPFECPPAPAYFTRQQVRAFGRGFDWYVFSHRDDTLALAEPFKLAKRRYERRGMQQAFLCGWDAAKRLDV